MVLAVAGAVTQLLVVSVEMVLPIAAPVMVEMPLQVLPELMVVVAVVAQVDQEMRQVQQAVMALCLSPLTFSLA
jgi:hypothetical protein